MTAVVGVLCKNGVVIGTDSSATFVHGHQFRTIEQPTDKLHVIDDHIIAAGTGSIGIDQRFRAIVEKSWSERIFQKSPIEVAKHLSRTCIGDLAYTYIKPGQYGALVAFPFGDKPQLCEFQISDFQPELKTERLWYCSLGSAQPITDPFLGLIREVFWQKGPPGIPDGIFAVTWTLEHAVKVNPGGVNGPIRIAILERVDKGQLKARMLTEDELGQHRQNVDEVKEHLREFSKKHQPGAAGNLEIPKPSGLE